MQIVIEKLRLPVKLGCTAEERAYPQIVDVGIHIDLTETRSADSDSLADTVDYMMVVQKAEEVVKAREFHLLEHLAADIARAIVRSEKFARAASVSVIKQIVPHCAGIAVRLTVDREGNVI